MYYNFTNQNGIKTRISISNGNKKLKPTKDKKFIIFNLPALITCPYATEHCKQLCYAVKSERAYPNTKKARINNYNAVCIDLNEFVTNMQFIIDKQMNRPSFKQAKAVFFRIHESGDLFSKAYTDAWLKIIEYSKKYKNLYFNLYTKSIDFLPFTAEYYRTKYKNLIINISIWDDTDTSTLNRAYNEQWDLYTADTEDRVKALLKRPNYKKCRCSDCANCQLCLKQHKKSLKKVCVIH